MSKGSAADAERYPSKMRHRQPILNTPFSTYPFFVIKDLIDRDPFQDANIDAVRAALEVPPAGAKDDVIIFE